MRNVKLLPVADKGVQAQPMTLVAADVKAPGGIEGTGPVLVVDHTSDNGTVTFRFKHADVKMQAAEEDFTIGGHKFRAGAFIIPNADRAEARAHVEGPRPVRLGGGERPDREDARPRRAAHRVRALVVEHAERRVGEGRVRRLRRALHLLRRHSASRGEPAGEVRRDRISPRRAAPRRRW